MKLDWLKQCKTTFLKMIEERSSNRDASFQLYHDMYWYLSQPVFEFGVLLLLVLFFRVEIAVIGKVPVCV